jgi:hypothetical protein
MLIRKMLLAAAAVMALAAPVAASAQDFGGYGYDHRPDFGRYEQRRDFYWRHIEREREIRREEWRARFDYRPGWHSDRGFYRDHGGWDDHRPY